MTKEAKGHITIGDMINIHQKASGKFTFRGLSDVCDPVAPAGPFAEYHSWTFAEH